MGVKIPTDLNELAMICHKILAGPAGGGDLPPLDRFDRARVDVSRYAMWARRPL